MLLYLAGLLSLSSLASGAHVEEEVQAPFSERTAWEVIANDPETSMWHDVSNVLCVRSSQKLLSIT